MYRITLRVPEDLASKIEKYTKENESVSTKQHAYRLFLEAGFEAIVGDQAKNYARLAEISAALALENRHYLRQLYRINFDAKKSKFDEPESEFNYVREDMKAFIQSIIKKGEKIEDDTQGNQN